MVGAGHPPNFGSRLRADALRLGVAAVGMSIGFRGVLGHLAIPLRPGLGRSIQGRFLLRRHRRRREPVRRSLCSRLRSC